MITAPCDVYLDRYASDAPYAFQGILPDNLRNVIVIPAMAESGWLFRTLESLAHTRGPEREHTLCLCVINQCQRHLGIDTINQDNAQTIAGLDYLLGRRRQPPDNLRSFDGSRMLTLREHGLFLAYLDATSPSLAFPDPVGGVGFARKVGMDRALRLLASRQNDLQGYLPLIFCLDADTLVEAHYLTAVRQAFRGSAKTAAVLSFAHQIPDEPDLQRAIVTYELYLRHYVMGLAYAQSPYAYHTIGSTMVCTALAYVQVRGMNRRQAAEDFHFLNKLAKLGFSLYRVENTTVFPAARPSHRVPFGTGRYLRRSLEAPETIATGYHPMTFILLRKWLEAMHRDPDRSATSCETTAARLHPSLAAFLEQARFGYHWARIRKNNSDCRWLRRQFSGWFDALKTLQWIHYLSRHIYSTIPLVSATKELLRLHGMDATTIIPREAMTDPQASGILLDLLRGWERSR